MSKSALQGSGFALFVALICGNLGSCTLDTQGEGVESAGGSAGSDASVAGRAVEGTGGSWSDGATDRHDVEDDRSTSGDTGTGGQGAHAGCAGVGGSGGKGGHSDAGAAGGGGIVGGNGTGGAGGGAGQGGLPDAGGAAGTGGHAEAGGQGGQDAGIDAGGMTFPLGCPLGSTYSDSFDTDPADRWIPLVGTWTWDPPSSLYSTSVGAPHDFSWIGARPNWTDYSVVLQVRMDTASGDGGVVFRVQDTGPTPPPNNAGHMYYAGLHPDSVVLGRHNNDYQQITSVPRTFVIGQVYTLRVDAVGASLKVSIDADKVIEVDDNTYGSGSIGLRTYMQGMSYGSVSVICH